MTAEGVGEIEVDATQLTIAKIDWQDTTFCGLKHELGVSIEQHKLCEATTIGFILEETDEAVKLSPCLFYGVSCEGKVCRVTADNLWVIPRGAILRITRLGTSMVPPLIG